MKVLSHLSSVDDARRTLVGMGGSALESPVMERLRRIGLNRTIKLGDYLKSWDLLETVRFLQDHVLCHEHILDIGAFASEITVSLHKLGYANLSGVDLNRRVLKMPFNHKIDYRVSDFMDTPYSDGAFKAVTSISVIEHGLDQTALLREMSRLLQVGGFFISSFDYWVDKIDTVPIKIFDMSWLIFSRQDVESFVAEAANFNLKPVGPLNFECGERAIDCFDRQYTFGWLVLEKVA